MVRFATDGRVLVAEQSGVIKSFSGAGDTTPKVVADLRPSVHNFWDRGLLAIALDPDFPANRRIYVSYTYDAPIGGTAPTCGDHRARRRLSPARIGTSARARSRLRGQRPALRLTADRYARSPPEQVLINDWCQQYPEPLARRPRVPEDGIST